MATAPGDRLRNLPQYLLPQRLSSRAAYRLTRWRWLRKPLISAFSRYFDVDMSEAAQPDPYAYPHFNAFFTRALRPEVRPIAPGPRVLCCPVDGAVSQAGLARADALLQAKGHDYSLVDLLGGECERARPFRDGAFATLYLSPRDYHRIHCPLDARLSEMIYIPGKLFSVSPLTTRAVPGLFARNERLVNLFDTAAGPMAMVMVGAVNVGSMETVWAGQVTPPYRAAMEVRRYRREQAPCFDKGAEIGRFNMGSTVILLFAAGQVRWAQTLRPGATVKMGQAIGELI